MNSGKDLSLVASEVYQIEANTASIVQAAEDLMSLTRSLKEAWVLGQIKTQSEDTRTIRTEDGEIMDIPKMAEQLLDEILK